MPILERFMQKFQCISFIISVGKPTKSSLPKDTNSTASEITSQPTFVNALRATNSTTVKHESHVKIYYVSLELDNQRSNETVVLHWSLPDDFKDHESEKDIPGMTTFRHEFVLGAVGVPDCIKFEAHEKSTGYVVKLNRKDSLKVIPSEAKNTIKVQVAVPKGMLTATRCICFVSNALYIIILKPYAILRCIT